MFNALNLFGNPLPTPLPPERIPCVVITKHEMEVRCCRCQSKFGSRRCSRCYAVAYCGQDCQRAQWPIHKSLCKDIEKWRNKTVSAGNILAALLGGEEKMLLTPLFRRGLFEHIDRLGPIVGDPDPVPRNMYEKYFLAREWLVYAYAEVGEQNGSPLAFRLAAENMLDKLCMSYKSAGGEHVRYIYSGWMIAANMDQEALNYLIYFDKRSKTSDSLPYLSIDEQEIEGDSYIKSLKEGQYPHWYHDYMSIALIKLKRMRELMVRRQKEKIRWKNFMMGAHERVGAGSAILKLRGIHLIFETMKNYVKDPTLNQRIENLSKQILYLLQEVQKCNPLIIKGLVDRRYLVDPEEDQNVVNSDDEFEDPFEDNNYDPNDALTRSFSDMKHDACWGLSNYGAAWHLGRWNLICLRTFLWQGFLPIADYEKDRISNAMTDAADVDPRFEIDNKKHMEEVCDMNWSMYDEMQSTLSGDFGPEELSSEESSSDCDN